MHLDWTKEQIAEYERSVEFARLQLEPGTAERDCQSQFSPELWLACAKFGVLGWCFPEQYGGGGLDLTSTIRRLEGIGYGCSDNGLTLGLNGQMWSVQEPLMTFGNDEQKQRYLSALCRGEILAAHGMTEKNSGSDAFALSTSAKKVDGGYLLNGEKHYVGLAPVADIALIFARTDPNAGQWGISAFIVEKGFEGYSAGSRELKMGLRSSPVGSITMNNCFVPMENRLGPEGIGVSIFTHSMDWERGFIFASHLGAMHRQFDTCVEYARNRKQFGRPIGQFQAVSHRVADMKVRLDTARMLLYRVAKLKEDGKPCTAEAAMAKLHISESLLRNSEDAVRIHGALGYFSEYGIERSLRDAAGGVIYSGSSDIQRNIIASSLGL